MKTLLVVCLLLGSTFAADTESDHAVALAKILAEKGTISATDLEKIESSSDKLDLLAQMLRDKGVLSAEDYSKVSNDPPAPVVTKEIDTSQLPAPAAQAPSSSEVRSSLPLQVYGTLLVNGFYNTALTNNEDIPLFASKRGSDPSGNDKNFAMTARQSRFGLRLRGPEVAGARLSGQFEFDFLGGKAAFTNGIDMDLPRLRLGFGRLDWESWSFEAGQDWAIFAPLNPVSLAEYAIPMFSTSGNLWIRLPQLRAEYHHALNSKTTLLTQFAALDPNMGDFPTTTFTSSRTPLIGERGRAPGFETRFNVSRKVADRDYSVGISTHYARGKNFGLVSNSPVFHGVDSWGVALDYILPLTKQFSFTGEAYEGRALGIFSSASGEAILPIGTPGAHGVESRGGWIQAQYNFNPQWQLNLGYGIESEPSSNLRIGDRSKNQTYTTNVLYKLSKNVTFAWEYRRFLTNYNNQSLANNEGDHANVAVAYSF